MTATLLIGLLVVMLAGLAWRQRGRRRWLATIALLAAIVCVYLGWRLLDSTFTRTAELAPFDPNRAKTDKGDEIGQGDDDPEPRFVGVDQDEYPSNVLVPEPARETRIAWRRSGAVYGIVDKNGVSKASENLGPGDLPTFTFRSTYEVPRLADLPKVGGPFALIVEGVTAEDTFHGECKFLEKMEGVQSLTIRYVRLTREDMALVGGLKDLRRLEFAGCRINDGGIRALTALPKLEAVNFVQCHKLPPMDELGELADIPRLRSLELRVNPASSPYDPVLGALAKQKRLRRLVLAVSNEFLEDQFTVIGLRELRRLPALEDLSIHVKLNRECLRAVTQIKSLSRLDLRSAGLTHELYSELSGHEKLESLEVSAALWAKTDWELALTELKKAPNLKKLNLEAFEVNSAVVRAVARLPRLESLQLPRVDATDDAMLELSRHPSLRSISLTWVRQSLSALAGQNALRNLMIASKSLSSADVKVLKSLQGLRVLVMSRSALVDESLDAIVKLTNLQSIYLTDYYDGLTLLEVKTNPAAIRTSQPHSPAFEANLEILKTKRPNIHIVF